MCCSSTALQRANAVATRELRVYDFRTNQRFTLRERPLKRADLDDFVKACGAKNRRHERKKTLHGIGKAKSVQGFCDVLGFPCTIDPDPAQLPVGNGDCPSRVLSSGDRLRNITDMCER